MARFQAPLPLGKVYVEDKYLCDHARRSCCLMFINAQWRRLVMALDKG